MLRAVLLASPLALVLVVSCTSSDSIDFKDVGPSNTAGTTSSTGGASAGGTSSQAGSNATGGSNAAAGKQNGGGNGNMAGNQSSGGKQNGGGNANAGAPPDGGASPNGEGGTNTGGTSTGGTDTGGTNTGGTDIGGTDTGGTNTGGTNTGGTNTGPLCPDIFGSYTITNVDGGQNCSGIGKNANQSIAGTDVACFAHFVSLAANPGVPTGVNGGVALDENGDFKGATLYLNGKQRTQCSGVWEANNERMTIKCGALGSQCTVLMERN